VSKMDIWAQGRLRGNGRRVQALAYLYSRQKEAEARQAKVLTAV
jgi:hypothetical protein